MLNEDAVSGRMRSTKGWSPATVSRLLDNEKYIGRWVWNKTELRRDPRTGRRRPFPKPESEWITHNDESLRIVPQDLWETVRLRRQEVRRSWPGGKGHRGFSAVQGGREKHFPTHLLSGAMVCGTCGATMAEVSGKGGGYYGCLGATKGACENKLLVRRTLVEKIILDTVRERLSSPEHIEYVLRRVEAEVGKLYAHIPESIRLKETELAAEGRRLANFVDFIGEGRGSRTLAHALLETERKVEALKEELDGLHRSREKVFQVPPIEWIQERLTRLKEILERSADRSGLALRNLLGQLRLEPTRGDIGRPYYTARTSLNTLALLDTPLDDGGGDTGSNSLRWWRRGDSNSRPPECDSGALPTELRPHNDPCTHPALAALKSRRRPAPHRRPIVLIISDLGRVPQPLRRSGTRDDDVAEVHLQHRSGGGGGVQETTASAAMTGGVSGGRERACAGAARQDPD